MSGVKEKLEAGAVVADVGCGHGASVIAMAEAFPKSTFHGFDSHEPSIAAARDRAKAAGVSERITFEVGYASSIGGEYDLICFFDCFHDMGDPEGAARNAAERLKPGGKILLVEPNALSDRRENIESNPIAAMMYTVSSSICVPCSLSQEGGLGLGAQAGEAKLTEVLNRAGLANVRRVAETPINIILEVSP
jgi:2-polyprenyl-3-methyl-5-hydroxy-6-metoxy-1,4-benzoquinol methylase